MKTLRYGLIVLVVGFVFGVALAQDTLPPNRCTQNDYQWVSEQLDIFSGNFRDIATYDPIAVAYDVRSLMNSMQMYCSGVFTNETHPNGIIGPIAFDGTIYEVTFVGIPTGSFDVGGSVTLEELSGDCGILNMMMISSSNMEETNLWRFGGDCQALIEVHRSGD